jgi:hypothetical protein
MKENGEFFGTKSVRSNRKSSERVESKLDKGREREREREHVLTDKKSVEKRRFGVPGQKKRKMRRR